MPVIITLLTDFGTRDSYVGEMRGVLLTRAPNAILADISHDIPPGDISAAAYVLGRTRHTFPPSTVHLAVVDPGVGSTRAAIALQSEGQYFVGPDNGVFTPALDAAETIVRLPLPPVSSATFHGRDVFAPAAAAIATGMPLEQLGGRVDAPPVRLASVGVMRQGNAILGQVVHVDRFGTLVTSLPPEAGDLIEIAGARVPLRRTFADVASGELVAFVGSGGTVEIAVRDGSAVARLSAGVGDPVRTVRADG
ncbi:MAG TPA: SAM-dependent chlorinase/fluorinase [Gemmatimonadales bacterium]|nr:SAM-dependent chlorinase/fluorinase [Gemmatimonadales bacterium]